MAYDRRALVGVGGWLAFFIITLGLNALAVLVVTVATLAKLASVTPHVAASRWHAYLVIVGLLGAGKVAGYVYMAWRLNARHDARTPPLVIRLLWTVVLVPAIVDAVAGLVFLDVTAQQAGYLVGTGMGRPAIYAAIWTTYLLRSRRVANTYATPAGDDELAAVFG